MSSSINSSYTVIVRSKKDNSVIRKRSFSSVDYYLAMDYYKLVASRYSKSFNVDFKIKMKKVGNETA